MTTMANKGLPKVVAQTTTEHDEALAKLETTSAKIRYLAANGFSNEKNLYSGIANKLGLRTQHVRNVLTQQLKKS